ncbi:MAG TPA: hypothetical protein VG271_13070, partial [Beijerinckiaceae bacterium]|nr:hypothetical protein [Beijerinckiaceae bacterium]
LSLGDFEAIEAAVSETTRGRWFLAEYARRLRARETDKVLTALSRLEQAVTVSQKQLPSPQDPRLTEALAAACERLRDMAWTLRERGLESGFCAAIECEADILARLQAPADVLLDRLSALASAEPAKTSSMLIERIDPLRPASMSTPPEAAATSEAAEVSRARAGPTLMDIDELPFPERLRFFA